MVATADMLGSERQRNRCRISGNKGRQGTTERTAFEILHRRQHSPTTPTEPKVEICIEQLDC